MVKLDHGIKEPTQDLPLIEKPTTSGTRSKKTTCRRVGRPRNKGLHGARPSQPGKLTCISNYDQG
ncbi:hypothetical protein U9M48_010268 [Paspalum notatum var. saurae]|uniref:Uncharacterized protein n=1 Tax=Paspalum notatum var. saurae TaxID=547442 RepID=A0AAQ3ST47_PASNO